MIGESSCYEVRDSEQDKGGGGLDAGADDFITQAFAARRNLLARGTIMFFKCNYFLGCSSRRLAYLFIEAAMI